MGLDRVRNLCYRLQMGLYIMTLEMAVGVRGSSFIRNANYGYVRKTITA